MIQRYRYIILLLLCIGAINQLVAQFSISPQLPPSGVVKKSQLWNALLVSSNPTPITVAIKLTINNSLDNQPILTAYTKNMVLFPGVLQVGYTTVTPVVYNYLSPTLNTDRDPNGFLPMGSFTICYTLVKVDGDLSFELITECTALDVAPLSPPQLSYPPDKDTLISSTPLLSWIPPAPTNMFNAVNYEVIVAEVFPNQTPIDAVKMNLPILNRSSITATNLLYPSSAQPLEHGKTYAWKVLVKNNTQTVATTDVWTFEVAKNTLPIAALPDLIYYELEKKTGTSGVNTIINKGQIGAKFYSYDKTYEATILIKSVEGVIIKTEKKTIMYGNNFFVFQLDNSFSPNKTYVIELTDLNKTANITAFQFK